VSKTTKTKKPVAEVISAGGVLINKERCILFCHPTGSRWSNWRMPKGMVNPGENIEAAALREVLEETGYTCNILSLLETDVRYKTSNEGKSVLKILKMYLMEPIKKVQEPDWENDKFVWVEASKLDSYVAEREKELILEALTLFASLKKTSA